MHLTYPACVAHIVADDVDAAWRVTQYASSTQSQNFGSAEFGVFISTCSVERYKGDVRAAWERVERVTPMFDESPLIRVAVIRAFSAYERGLSAVAAAAHGHDGPRALRAAAHYARQLVKEKMPYAPPMGHLLRAGAHAVRGDHASALGALDAAIPLLDAADLGYLAACARYRRGELAGGVAGAGEVARSRAFFEAQGVMNIERCLAMSAPGF
jgi:IS1 family transposase